MDVALTNRKVPLKTSCLIPLFMRLHGRIYRPTGLETKEFPRIVAITLL